MTPYPSKLKPRLVPSTGWTGCEGSPGNEVPVGGGLFIEANVDTTCFSMRAVTGIGEEDLIHVCDWPELRATIDQFMADRAAEAGEEVE
jgi:hypothetical protein